MFTHFHIGQDPCDPDGLDSRLRGNDRRACSCAFGAACSRASSLRGTLSVPRQSHPTAPFDSAQGDGIQPCRVTVHGLVGQDPCDPDNCCQVYQRPDLQDVETTGVSTYRMDSRLRGNDIWSRHTHCLGGVGRPRLTPDILFCGRQTSSSAP